MNSRTARHSLAHAASRSNFAFDGDQAVVAARLEHAKERAVVGSSRSRPAGRGRLVGDVHVPDPRHRVARGSSQRLVLQPEVIAVDEALEVRVVDLAHVLHAASAIVLMMLHSPRLSGSSDERDAVSAARSRRPSRANSMICGFALSRSKSVGHLSRAAAAEDERADAHLLRRAVDDVGEVDRCSFAKVRIAGR